MSMGFTCRPRSHQNAVDSKRIRLLRFLPFDSILPLRPIFAKLFTLESLAGGAGAIVKTVIDAENAKMNWMRIAAIIL